MIFFFKCFPLQSLDEKHGITDWSNRFQGASFSLPDSRFFIELKELELSALTLINVSDCGYFSRKINKDKRNSKQNYYVR